MCFSEILVLFLRHDHDIQRNTFNKRLHILYFYTFTMELTLTKLTAEKNKTEQNKTLTVTRKTQNTFFWRGVDIAQFSCF